MNMPFWVGTAFAFFGLYLLLHALSSRRRALASMAWPRTEGRLTDVRLWGLRNIGGQMKDAQHLSVDYEYAINGRQYAGTSVAFYTLVFPATMDFAERHHPMDKVTVYYHPKDPGQSVLIPGVNQAKPYSDIILGSLAIAIGLGIAALSWFGVIG